MLQEKRIIEISYSMFFFISKSHFHIITNLCVTQLLYHDLYAMFLCPSLLTQRIHMNVIREKSYYIEICYRIHFRTTFISRLSWKRVKLIKEISKSSTHVFPCYRMHTCGEKLKEEEKNVHNYPSKRIRRMTVNRRGNIESRWRGEPWLDPARSTTLPFRQPFSSSYAEIYRRILPAC